MDKLRIRACEESVELSKIILGTGSFGTGIPETASFEQMDEYAAQGGDTLDTAAIYGDWEDKGTPISEATIGKWLRKSGAHMRIITKGCHPRLGSMHIPRVTPEAIRFDLERSLDTLGVEAVDVYLLHRDDPAVPVGEILEALAGYVRAGRVRAIGVSNWRLPRLLEANAYARARGLPHFSCSSIQWSLAHREREPMEGLPYMTREDYARYLEAEIPVLAWSSQAGGIVRKLVEGKEVRSDEYRNAITQARAERVRALCASTGLTPTQISLAYITCNRLAGAAVIGASNIDQLRDSLRARDAVLTQAQIEWLTDGYFAPSR